MKLMQILNESPELEEKKLKEIYAKMRELKNLMSDAYNDSVPNPLRGNPIFGEPMADLMDALDKKYLTPMMTRLKAHLPY